MGNHKHMSQLSLTPSRVHVPDLGDTASLIFSFCYENNLLFLLV
jgi:hypothetical protein